MDPGKPENLFHLVVFEHEVVRVDTRNARNKQLQRACYEALCAFHGENGVPYFRLVHNGVRFCEYVGVLQVGRFTIEVLPKADKNGDNSSETKWQRILIRMLRESGNFPVEAPSSSNLNLKSNSILDLYIRSFLDHVNTLIHQGLVKKYRKTEGNMGTLKGRLLFNRQLQRNLVHAERFYTAYSVYDRDHIYHQLLFKTLKLIAGIAPHNFAGEASRLQLSFPEQDDIRVTECTFSLLRTDRKIARYAPALKIARLLLLNYHPDVAGGRNHVLALLFDMNRVWEACVLHKFRNYHTKIRISASADKKAKHSGMAAAYVRISWSAQPVIPRSLSTLSGKQFPTPSLLSKTYGRCMHITIILRVLRQYCFTLTCTGWRVNPEAIHWIIFTRMRK
ncbi:hypothetical protein GS398_03800 [Pedobacter sp. HMF7056]|uniref:Restriction endonuclease n=1 Tax=Hufsiella ginkgonis TaxID=2695274 RepID=A0A7K1XUG2_9SPHI|nr:hypothetical protein [Hufsiella ginkgonis]MXV14409.1 hypothetical protein [Hufsiella ginkgonis]